MRGSIILFLIVILVLSYGIANQSTEDEVNDDSEDQDDNCDDEDEAQNKNCSNDFVGTNLFGDDCDVNKCFSSNDVALLMARKDFENLIPKDLPKCLLDDHLVEVLMKYFYSANQVIVRMSNGNSKRIAQLAFYDTLGGYLQHYLIPVAKYSFYAGIVKLKTTVNIVQLLNQCKLFLNTNGNGWMESIFDFSEFDLGIEPIKILKQSDEKGCESECAGLILADDESEDDEIIVPLPKLDPEEYGLLSNIWLPFKRKHHFNLRSHSSAFVLLRYYVLVTRCYQFQGVHQDTFNHKFKEWYQECIESHLSDDILYPGLGAVLRIIETLRNRKKNVFMPYQQTVDGSSFSRTCPFPKKQSAEFMRLNNKVGKLSDPSRQKSLSAASLSHVPPAVGDVVMFDEDDSPSLKARRKKHITIAVLVLLFLLVFILAVAVLTKYMSNKSGGNVENGEKKKKDKKQEKEETKKHEKEEKKKHDREEKKHDKEEKKKHDKEEKKHDKEEKKKHEKEEKKKHEEEKKKKHEEEKKKHEDEKKHEKEERKHEKEERKHEKEEKKHEKEEKKKHEKEERKHEKEEKKHEKEEKKHEKEGDKKQSSDPKYKMAKSTDRHEGGSESSTSSSSSSSPRSSRTPRRYPRDFSKGGLKLSLVDEKGRTKKFSISKKNKPTSIVQLPTHSPRIRKRSNSMDSGGGLQLRKGAISTSWETID